MREPMKRGTETKEKILKTGVKLWLSDQGKVTATAIAHAMKISHSLVIYHFPKNLKDAVADYAFKIDNLNLIALLIATNHKSCKKLSDEQRRDYIQRIWGAF